MSTRDRLTLAAALAVALAGAALVPVFDGLGWLLRVLLAVAVVAVAAGLARRAGLPRALEPIAALLGLGAYVGLAFARSTLTFGVVPTGETLRVLGDVVRQGLLDVEELAPPVPTSPGLVLLAVLGVGAIAVLVDLLAVTCRKAAVAGLPLLLLFAVPAAVLPGGLGWWPFALGAGGWLGLLLADGSDAVSRWGTPLRTAGRGPVTSDPSLNRVGRRIGAAALGVAVVVPALIPGLDGRLLGGEGGSGLGGSRTTTTYNPILELGGQLRLPEPGRLLMTYTTDDPAPDYLRLTTLDTFEEESGWTSSELSADLQDDAVRDGIPPPVDAAQVQADRFSTSIRVGRIDAPWLPTTFPPTDIDVDGAWLWDAESETVFSTRTSLREVDEPYRVDSARTRPTAELLRGASSVPSEIREVYAQPPPLSPFVQQLLDETVAGEETDYDKVAAIQALFRDGRNGFSYNEDADVVEGFDSAGALERFLRGKQGFCEQYASAMGALVRALGIPARVAVGFTPGSRRSDGSYQVTTDDAHAWPEVWFSGAGWVRFEPTPRASQVVTPGYTQPPNELPVAEEPSAAPAQTAAPETAAPADPGAVDRADDLDAAAGADADGGLSRTVVLALLAALGLLLLAALPSLLAVVRRRRRWATPGPLAAWAQVVDDAVDVGHAWRPADSPRAAAAYLLTARALPAAAADALARVAAAAERARYARPGAALDADGLAGDVRQVRRALLDGASRRAGLLARFAPPSTLRWASAGLGSATADLLDRFDAAVSSVGERVRHPRRRTAV